jgi:hypothetical protein
MSKRAREESNSDDANKKTKLESCAPIFTRQDAIKYMQDKEQKQQRSIFSNGLRNNTVKQLQEIAKSYGLSKTGTKATITSKIVEYKIQRKLQEKSEVDVDRVEKLTKFIAQYETLKESEIFPRDLNTLTIHIPLKSFGRQDHSSLFQQQYSFIKLYQNLEQIVSDGNVNSGDIIFVPPGLHILGYYDLHGKTIELIGMDSNTTNTVIQGVRTYKERKKLLKSYNCILSVSNCNLRLHNLSFMTGPVNRKVESSFISIRNSLFEVSYCRFDKMINAMDVGSSYSIIHHSLFTRMATCAIRLHQTHTTIIDQNQITNCCSGISEVFSYDVAVLQADENEWTKHNSVGVIHCTIKKSHENSFMLILRGNQIHDNEASAVTFKTGGAPPLLNEQIITDTNVIEVNDDNSSAVARLTNSVSRVYICDSPEEKWNGNQDCSTAVNVRYVSSRSDAIDYKDIVQKLSSSSYLSNSQTQYPLYQVRPASAVTNIYKMPSILNAPLDESRFPKVAEIETCSVYHYKELKEEVGYNTQTIYIVLKKNIVVQTSSWEGHLGDKAGTCYICNSALYQAWSQGLFKLCCDTIGPVKNTMKEYLNQVKDGKWRDDEFGICENGHIGVYMMCVTY